MHCPVGPQPVAGQSWAYDERRSQQAHTARRLQTAVDEEEIILVLSCLVLSCLVLSCLVEGGRWTVQYGTGMYVITVCDGGSDVVGCSGRWKVSKGMAAETRILVLHIRRYFDFSSLIESFNCNTILNII
jgi:hypothetical protein